MDMDLWITQRNIERCDQLLLSERDEAKRAEIKRQQAQAWQRLAELNPKQELPAKRRTGEAARPSSA